MNRGFNAVSLAQNCPPKFSVNFDQSPSELTCQIRRKEVFYVTFFSLPGPTNCYLLLLTNMACGRLEESLERLQVPCSD